MLTVKHVIYLGFSLLTFLLASFSGYAADRWPIAPEASAHNLNFLYGHYEYNTSQGNFMHSGLDISTAPYTPVYAVQGGYVKTVTGQEGPSSWRIVIGDAPGTGECEAWLYAHVFQWSIPSGVVFDQWIDAGTQIGQVADFSEYQYPVPHLHFSRIRYAGDWQGWADGQMDWVFIDNPLDLLPPDNDPLDPGLINVIGDQLLGFCANESGVFFDEGAVISGDVDIVTKAYDYYFTTDWIVNPYKLEYKIEGDSSIPWTTSVCFTGEIGAYDEMPIYIGVVYKNSSTTPLDFQQLYFTLTNTDGDLMVENSDKLLSWETPSFHNGDYSVAVKVSDKSGNSATDSMTVTVVNFFTLSGTVSLSDGNPLLSGVEVKIDPDGGAGTSNESGLYTIGSVGGGWQHVSFSKFGYEIDTSLVMNANKQLDVTLQPCAHVKGDANYDGAFNVGDAVFIVNYVFKGGAEPVSTAAGDANCDGDVNVGDAVFIINYVFKGGSAPCAGCLE